MKKVYLLLMMVFAVSGVWGQTTVFIDDFSTNQSATYTTTGAIGASAWSVNRSGDDWGARRNTSPAQLELTNDVGAIANVNGWVFANTPTASFTAPYNTQLNLNTSMITWTFNMRQIRPDPAGFVAGSYGVAFILAGSGTNGATGTTGYAVALGETGAVDPIRLIKYNNGMQGTIANIIVSNTAGLIDFGAEYLSIKVTYTPSTNTWELFLRNDGAAAFVDPTTGTLVTQGTAVDATFTGSVLGFMGGYWQGSTGANQTAFFDNVKVVAAATGTPTITVSPTTLTGFSSLSGVPSAEQNYTVSGANLTNDIIITPPVGFEISPTTGPFTPTNPITLIQSGGTVANTTIYVRMNSTTLGVNTGNIANTSTGATTQNVALTGNVLAPEPTGQSTITIGAVTNSTVVVNFSGGNGARRILLAKLATAVSSNPVDGTTYTANANFGSGSQIGAGNYVVYDGTLNTQLVTGLTAGAMYHFAIYEYNNGGVAGAENYLVPGGLGNATLASYSLSYVWVGLNGDWTLPVNWVPDRLFPATNDSLLFISSVTDTIINVPTQTVGYVGVSVNTNATFQSALAGNTLTIGNLTGTDLFVEAGSSLNIAGANALTLRLVTLATAGINGSMRFTAGAHRLTAVDASAITFNSGAVFTAGTGFSGNAFGAGTANSVVFANGSTYSHLAGSNPFSLGQPASVVVFNTGSLFKLTGNLTPSVSGRTYANFELDAPGAVISATGTALLTMDNLTVTNGSITFGMTTAGMNLKGNVSVASGATLGFAPASLGTLNLNGTAAQTITNNGTFSYGPFQNLTINNAAGVTLNSSITLGATTTLTLTAGILRLTPTATTVTLSSGTTLVGGNSNASYVDGKVKKIGNTLFTFPVGKTGFGYVPIGLSNFTGASAVTDELTAEYRRGNARLLGSVTAIGLDHVSGCDYWTLDLTNGTPTVDITAYWSINNICNGTYVNLLTDLVIAHFNGTSWDTYGTVGTATGTTTAGNVVWTGVSVFSPFSLGSISFNNPLPIIINYFTGAKQNGNHLLNWKLTCTTTPYANIELQRSSDGRSFTGIYSIFATALRCQQPFNYTDAAPAKGINYYRLKMTDADGKVTYSSNVALINASTGIDVMSIAPNPIVSGKFNVKISSANSTKMNLVISDMQGRILQQQTTTIIAGFNTVPVNVQNLAAGSYQVMVITADGNKKLLRFVVQ